MLRIDPAISHALVCDLYAQLAAAKDTIAELRGQLAKEPQCPSGDELPEILRTDPNDGPHDR